MSPKRLEISALGGPVDETRRLRRALYATTIEVAGRRLAAAEPPETDLEAREQARETARVLGVVERVALELMP